MNEQEPASEHQVVDEVEQEAGAARQSGGAREGVAQEEHLAVETLSLTKHYGSITAVEGLDLRIRAGTVYALLGPNGAGKTTTLSMLTTLIPPDSGGARVAGFDVVRQADEVRRRIGVTFQEVVLDTDLTGTEVLDYHGLLYGMPSGERRRRIRELLDLVQLTDAAGRKVKTYSGGMKRRLELARGLLTSPEVLFLDEPTQGLDPQNRAAVWDYLRRLVGEREITVVLSTHDMQEAQFLAGRVGIIDQGHLVIEGRPATLIAEVADSTVVVEGKAVEGSDAWRRFVTVVATLAGVSRVEELPGGVLRLGVHETGPLLPRLVEAAFSAGLGLRSLQVQEPSLADVFLRYTGRELRDA